MAKDVKRALMIARDQRALLRRIANIYPGPGGGMDPSPGGGGYSGPGGGKYIGPSRLAKGGAADAKARFLEGSKAPPRLYHGTVEPKDFSVFNVGQPHYAEDEHGEGRQRQGSGPDPTTYLGSHFAEEPEVANKFAKGLYGERKGATSGNRVYPVHLAVKNPHVTTEREMHDWMLHQSLWTPWVEHLLNDDDEMQARYEKDPTYRRHINESALDHEHEADEPTYETAQEMARKLRDHLIAKGHDGIKYQNEVEGGTSWIAFDPRQIKSASGNRGTYDPDDPDMGKSEGGYIGRATGGKVPPFKLHSGAAKIIGAKGQKKATPQQYAAMPGIKPDELKHSKFDTLGTKALPREEVIKHLEDNQIPIEETQLGGEGRNTSTKFEDKTLPGGKNYREVLLHLPDAGAEDFQKRHAAAKKAKADTFEHVKNMMDLHGYGDHPELLAAQQAYVDANKDFSKLQGEITERESTRYRSGHWEEPNVLAHVRMSDRVGPNGEKILHLEESQSDWGQQGRDQGFGRREGKVEQQPGGFWRITWPDGTFSGGYDTQTSAETALEYRGKGIPHGPYVDNTQKWTDLALKRVLHEAAHGGYDKIVVTPGDEQNKRYDLSKQVKNINYFPDIGYLHAETHDGRGIEHDNVKPEDLSKHIGKEAADRILKQGMQRHEGRGRLGGEFYHELEGDGLKMGGAGMRGYYDNILPKRLQALAQQHDPQAKVNLFGHPLATGTEYTDAMQSDMLAYHELSPTDYQRNHTPQARDDLHQMYMEHAAKTAGAELHSLDVTPQMRDSIKGNGFNSFKRGGDVGMRQRYADGGGADSPFVSRALDLASLAQPRSPIAQAQSTLRSLTTQPTEVGKTSVKSLSDAFDKGISEHLALKPADRIANSKRAADSLGAHIGRLQTGRPVPLLTKNAKLLKSETGYGDEAPVQLPDGRGIETTGLALAPAYQEGKFTTCPNSASCKEECLGKTSGNYFKVGGGKDLSAFKGPRLNSLKKTIGMLRDPENFAVRLNDEIESAKREAAMNGNHLGIRLNVLSDLNPRIHKAIIENHPDVTFYDYTKNNTNPIAPNHHYTYSSTGVSQDGVDNPHSNWKQMRKRLDTGSNVAMAFSDREHLPEMVHDEETGKHYKVVNGDKHDFRPLDIQPRGADGVIVGLKNKKATGTTANAHVESKGFFVKYDPQLQKNANGTYVRGESVGLRKDGKPMLGETIPTNRIVTIKSQRAAPALKTNDTGGGK